MVLAQAMYAIVGALSLEQGAAVANRITKERILANIGLRQHVAGSTEQLRL
jgi:large subunit ribosomal protein L15